MSPLRTALLWPSLLLWSLLPQAVRATPALPSIELAGIASRLVITPQVHVLRDADGRAVLTAVLDSTQWETIAVPMLQEGYSNAA
ncbi:hypothetical protein ABTE19_21855, partial [Acinetobacter baumannii]